MTMKARVFQNTRAALLGSTHQRTWQMLIIVEVLSIVDYTAEKGYCNHDILW